MKKVIAILAVGIVVGYFYGFQDARRHRQNVAVRVINSIGGDRKKYNADIDAQMDRLERSR